MRFATLFLALAVTLAACDSSTEPDSDIVKWVANLTGQGDFENVSGTVEVTSAMTFAAKITLTGAEPNSEYSWHVASNTCAEPGSVLGNASSYAKIETDEEGKGTATATVSASLDPENTYHTAVYFIEVNDDEEEVTVVVACGELEVEDDGNGDES